MANKELRRMEIEPAENGGHTVTHHYREMQREGRHGLQTSYVEPEHHVFGPDEHYEMLAHVATHLDIPEPKGDPVASERKEADKKGHGEGKGKNDGPVQDESHRGASERGTRLTREATQRVTEALR